MLLLRGIDDGAGQSDSDLLDRCVTGDVEAFDLLYDRHSRAAYGRAYRILGQPGDAEDIVQDAFLTMWRQSATYSAERGSVRAWLLTIVHHRAIDDVRRRGYCRQQTLDDVALVAVPDGGHQDHEDADGQDVRHALRRLPADQRHVVALAYVGGYTHDEIARRLGLPLGTVKSRLRLGLRKMRGYLARGAA